jgi:hypothetical protein
MAPTVHVPELALEELEADTDDALEVPGLEPADVPLDPPLCEAEADCAAVPLDELCEPALSPEPLAVDPPPERVAGPLSEFELQATVTMGTMATTTIRMRMRRAGCFIRELLETLGSTWRSGITREDPFIARSLSCAHTILRQRRTVGRGAWTLHELHAQVAPSLLTAATRSRELSAVPPRRVPAGIDGT